ncbi:Long-chain-fatty-acid--CoA ligase [Luteitalea pratensis]|uniref:Long-chain-fatty-acid--CoA ligase n=1 Tax=Luteitalea pratensis TaxID=1855912 RepID=A0A143PVY7_LUTPR|nr:AMP-binding protein [Luteitalea pratensis]AMY12333.1 Long-chain-fatty-acid--CoA ligase [Luteitalea pratensis]
MATAAPARATLIDFFHDATKRTGPFLVHDDGYRTWTFRYDEVGTAARRLAARLHATGLVKGDAVVLWGENRPEWIVAFWACLLRGIVVVPIDYRSAPSLVDRIAAVVSARLLLIGEDVDASAVTVDAPRWPLTAILREEAHASADVDDAPPVAITADDTAEIIFTSGATAEPKGVIITHRNVLANIVPIEREMAKYLRYIGPFSPIRFLNLLPLSHMFGQAMAAFVPPMLGGTVVFMRSLAPADVVRQISARRISVLVCVPKILDVLREHVRHAFPETRALQPPADSGLAALPKEKWYRRWWRFRRVHRAFGLKFWSAVVGAAPLDPALEEFWGGLGFLVVQGYGLTETAPIVTLNHPLHARKGTVGKPIHGVDVKIAEDGEILVRGDNVSQGYVGGTSDSARTLEDGWLHTGDIGSLDEQGRLSILGRKKEMIVTPDGLNVFPEDVERALLAQPGVRDAAVVGRRWDGEERVHAVVVLDDPESLPHVVQHANATLADHQKIRSASQWTGTDLPRTEGTRKLKRTALRAWVESGEQANARPVTGEDALRHVLARFAKGRDDVGDDTTLEALALSSLERVELLMALEQQFQTIVDEGAFAAARTVGDLRRLVGDGGLPAAADQGTPATPRVRSGRPSTVAKATVDKSGRSSRESAVGEAPSTIDTLREGLDDFPSWNRALLPSWVRRVSQATWILPIGRLFAWVRASGLEHLAGLEGPVVFAANHQSHMDTPVVLMALPRRWRAHTAVAMAKEFFTPHFHPAGQPLHRRVTNGLNYYLASLFFNAFPIPQRGAGTRHTLRYIGQLFEEGQSLLIFPEGKRTMAGEINEFRAGIGMIGAKLGVPVVPIRLVGADRLLHQKARFPTPGRVTVRFGPPIYLHGDDYAALARQVEAAVRALD